jgi:HAD superfamily hydrolase (TIGR01450 family)
VLLEASGPLVESHDLVMLDLDGVVYVGGEALPGVPEALARLRESGTHVAFVTNNASRPPERVAERLRRLGVEAEPRDVVTSAQAAARMVAERFGRGAGVWMLGGKGLEQALLEAGLHLVDDPEDAAVAVSGYGPEVLWRDIMRTAVLVRGGLPYVATNTDRTVPTEHGMAPGHGVLVRTIADFAGVEPVVAGKPAPPLLEETIRRVGGDRPLMVGDRLDTDVEGAHAVGVPSLLVLTGVSGLPDLVRARPDHRPSYVSADLEGLFVPHPVPRTGAEGVELGGWQGRTDGDELLVSGAGDAGDWWRVVACAAWQHLDATGRPADVSGLRVPVPDRDGARG